GFRLGAGKPLRWMHHPTPNRWFLRLRLVYDFDDGRVAVRLRADDGEIRIVELYTVGAIRRLSRRPAPACGTSDKGETECDQGAENYRGKHEGEMAAQRHESLLLSYRKGRGVLQKGPGWSR